ncbi:cation-translocating P-type ATPase [Mycolicibacter hiberniae]|uniref:cation-translocating P-type ATPase n=1 Tax=Mycolicibacter hiberniae TaxID=29314 RepID=UPI0013FDD665|nr:cation-translocating P-type ATPase [Mycolicibacter hiberniae]MCV7086768.1 cation-translocating P-type ATPase [Mycolicibacter hiberniae]
MRPVALGLRTASVVLGAAVRGTSATAEAVGGITSAGVQVAALPIREATRLLSGESAAGSLTRNCWRGQQRAWIEVRGLNDSPDVGQRVLDTLNGEPAVVSARLNRPLSRVVVELADDAELSLPDLCRLTARAERGSGGVHRPTAPICATPTAVLPGDGLLLMSRGVMVGVNAAGLAIAFAGRALRLPHAPVAVDAVAAMANYQPWVRRRLADQIGRGAADTVLSLISTGARIATLSPATLAVDLALQGIKAAESQAAAQAWTHHEPHLAAHAEQTRLYPPSRPMPLPEGAVDRHGRRAGYVQLFGSGVVGALTGNLSTAATAAVVTSPKAMRSTTEAFAATLCRSMVQQHAALPLRPDSLRRLDRVDAVLIDPRLLCTADTHHPLAAALLAQARASGAELITLDVAALGELRPAFDELAPPGAGGDDALDAALADALTARQQDGRTVAVLTSTGAKALAGADVGLGILVEDAALAPPWEADLLLTDLAGAWRVLHAIPAARQAAARGIALATGASTLGAVLMVPGVRGGRGPGPVTAGAATGLLSGYLLARQAARTPAPRPAPAHEWHALSAEEVRGILSAPDLAGTNAASEAAPPPVAWQFVKAVRAELSDPLMPVLALSSAATAMLGSPVDAMMVSTVLIGNCMLAAAQQLQAENRLNRLLAQQTPPARIVEPDTGTYGEIAADRLLPGAVIEVRSNEVVPADARLIEATDLEVDESSLTGESLSVDKQTAATPGAELAERRCMIYAGTTVVAGTARAVVTAVGPDTQARRAAELAAGDLPVVGLQHQLSQLMSRAFPASAAGGLMVGLLGLLRGGGLRLALGNAIAVAVAAVPEGMPLMATLAQHASAQRLTDTGALVRIPRSVEALGRVEVVCFDKTGTLSENRLRVTRVHPVAGFSDDDVLRCAANAAPAPEGDPHTHATDQAVAEAAARVATGDTPLWSTPDAHLPFRSGRAFSASVLGRDLMIKGAPEVVLAACTGLCPDSDAPVAELAAGGLRVIAVARRRLTAAQVKSLADEPDALTGLCRSGLTLTGFLGISDTPRPEAPQLLADLAERGIGIRLITGDHPVTATAIAAELGVPVTAEQVITGAEWNALSRRDQEQAVGQRVIFARMSPENKVQVVQTLERSGRVCAMVGDGANDAAAIRAASVGLGVVARGSDSAHATADIVLTDGRIGALVHAIDEGQRLWRGVQLAVTGLLGGNVGEVIFGVVGAALSGTSPLNNRQLLLMNMLTDALPATAVAVSTPAGASHRVVRGIDERRLMRAVALRGAITGAAASVAWGLASLTGRRQRAATVALIALVTTELAQTLFDSHAPLVLATAAGSFAAFAAMISLPGVSQLLGCVPVGPLGWSLALGAAGTAVLAMAAAPHLLPAGRRDAAQDSDEGAELATVQVLRPADARACPEDTVMGSTVRVSN